MDDDQRCRPLDPRRLLLIGVLGIASAVVVGRLVVPPAPVGSAATPGQRGQVHESQPLPAAKQVTTLVLGTSYDVRNCIYDSWRYRERIYSDTFTLDDGQHLEIVLLPPSDAPSKALAR